MDNEPRFSIPDLIFFVVSTLAAIAALMLALRAIQSGSIPVLVATLLIAFAVEYVCWMYWQRNRRKR
jgi:hypothetical protein